MTQEYRFDQIAIVPRGKKKPTEEDKGNYVGLEHLSPDTFDVVDYGSEVAPKGEKLVMKKGDVLFGKRRAYQKKVGIAPCDGIFSAHGMVLRPNEEVVDARFFPLGTRWPFCAPSAPSGSASRSLRPLSAVACEIYRPRVQKSHSCSR